jgi:hypothetical protein
MKKTTFLILILFGLKSYGQTFEETKTKIDKNIAEKKDIDKILSKQKTELAELNDLNKSDSTKIIIYDFKTKKYLNSNIRPKVGEPLIFKIQNINRLAYNIHITSTDVAIADEYFNPEIKKALEKEGEQSQKSQIPRQPTTISKLNITDESFIGGKEKKISKILSESNIAFQEKTESLEKLELEIQKLKKEEHENDEKIKILDQKSSTYTTDFDSLNTIKKQNAVDLNDKLKKIELLKLELNALKVKSSESEIMIEIHTTFNKLNKNYQQLYEVSQNLNNIEKKYLDFRRFALNPLLSCKEYQDAKYKPFLTEIPNSENTINDFEVKLIQFYNEYNTAMNDWRLFDKLTSDTRESIRNRYENIKYAVDQINQSIDTKSLSSKLRRASAIHSVLQNPTAYEMSSSPIQPLEDYVTFEIEIKNRDDQSQYEYNDERKFVYMEYTQGGVRFDFSTGVVFDFGNQPTSYQLTDADVNNNKQIIGTSKNVFTPTLAGMFHTSFRRNGMWAFGLTLGASLNVETFQLNSLFPGISLLIGKKQKFVITTGPAFKQVETLKSNYETDTPYNEANLPSSSDLTSKQFKIGYFVGITYNLTKEQKGTFKISDK